MMKRRGAHGARPRIRDRNLEHDALPIIQPVVSNLCSQTIIME
jgi:hypothetical protein